MTDGPIMWTKKFAQGVWESAVESASKWRLWVAFCASVVVLETFSVPDVLIGYLGCMLAYEIGLFVPWKQGSKSTALPETEQAA